MYSVQISWTNPSVTLQEVEEVVSPILGEDYDGIVVEDKYLYVRSNSPISVENEYSIKDKIYLLNNQPQSVNIVSAPEPEPFAIPSYRTKRNATASIVTIEPSNTQTIDFKLTAERYVSGGCLVIENAEFGDYCTAEVIDIDGVIPEIYRSTMCENYPTVAMYIEKEFIKVKTPGTVTAGSITQHEIDTYPLHAKITPGLYLRVTYTAVNSGLNRRAVVNYHLTKKL
jgi:hypothetical protein